MDREFVVLVFEVSKGCLRHGIKSYETTPRTGWAGMHACVRRGVRQVPESARHTEHGIGVAKGVLILAI